MNERLWKATSGDAQAGRSGFGKWIAGRANRKEYWIWMGPILVLELLFAAVPPLSFPLAVVRLLVFIRRMHDLGWTGWTALVLNVGLTIASMVATNLAGAGAALGVVSLLLLAAIVALGCGPGQPRDNEYGPPPGGRRPDDLGETFS